MVRALLYSAPVLGLLLPDLVSARPRFPSRIQKRDPEEALLGAQNFPDPSLWNYDGTYYMFGTNDGLGNNIPMTSNSDFTNANGWTARVDAFPPDNVPAFSNWAQVGTTWAPDVSQLTDGDGSFIMYYSPQITGDPNNRHCISVARSGNIQGPYNDSSTAPWICPLDAGGAIDPNGFLDTDNNRYVVWKVDGPASANGGYCASSSNPTNYNTSIMLLQVANDGYQQLTGSVVLYENAGESDQYNIEAPSLVNVGGTYYLFFTSGCYSDDTYTLNYVTASNIWGPYGNRQVLLDSSDYGLHGPGSNDVTPDGTELVFHSLVDDNSISGGRQVNSATLTYNSGTITVN